MTSSLRNLVARRDLVYELTKSELRSESADSSLGWLWWLFDPILMMLIYWAVVVGIFERGAREYAPYPVFVLAGLVTWKFLASSLTRSARVLRNKESLIKSVPFPTIVLPLAVVGSGFLYFLFGFLVLASAAALFAGPSHSGRLLPLVQIPALMLFQLAAVTGLSLAVSCFGVLVRDLNNVMSHAVRVAFYLTPGLYGADLVQTKLVERFGEATGGALFLAFMANPFAALITGYRDAIFYGRFLPAPCWAMLALSSLALLALGLRVYQYYDRRVIKFL